MSCLQFVGSLDTFVGLKRFSTSVGSLLHIVNSDECLNGENFKIVRYLEPLFTLPREYIWAGVEMIQI